ncbi:hypothetical protein [Brochothrix thermosphacta]|uniref:hypothetical protein n=1 Tax=Brochothrix thermosphacta TaxID=2756 RepID=UPI00265CB691|nr:hypothetical protein [Brochothrix thermosphacta]WKK69239.1 hypothetical protein Q0G00_00960 [Brochothrix thermosphacta]
MHLRQSRIRNTNKLLNDVEKNLTFFIGVNLNEITLKIIQRKLNITKINKKETVFPTPFNGIMSERNSVGEFIPQKNKPKETAYRSQSWETQDWGGNSHSGTSYVPYTRYPRLFIEPKEMKYNFATDKDDNQIFIITQSFLNNQSNIEEILFAANLTLEIFNEVDTFILNSDKDIINSNAVDIVNWEILPKGEQIWDSFSNKTTDKLTPSEQILVKERFDYINSFNPDVVRQGVGGYTGYLIFEFTDKNLFIFDSILYGDAMYVFKNDWINVSRLTKREIIQNELAEERIIHNKSWKAKLNRFLK